MTRTLSEVGILAVTCFKNSLLGLVWEPPSHQPPMPKWVACHTQSRFGPPASTELVHCQRGSTDACCAWCLRGMPRCHAAGVQAASRWPL